MALGFNHAPYMGCVTISTASTESLGGAFYRACALETILVGGSQMHTRPVSPTPVTGTDS